MDIYSQAHENCKPGKTPIFLTEIEFIKQGRRAKKDLTLESLIKKRGLTALLFNRKSNVSLFKVKNVVCSGDVESIKINPQTLFRVIYAYRTYDKDKKKIASNYDYTRIKIHKVKFIKLLGYGIK